jgi:hypothetical protein
MTDAVARSIDRIEPGRWASSCSPPAHRHAQAVINTQEMMCANLAMGLMRARAKL